MVNLGLYHSSLHTTGYLHLNLQGNTLAARFRVVALISGLCLVERTESVVVINCTVLIVL